MPPWRSKTPTESRSGQGNQAGDSGRCVANRGSGAGVDLVHLHRVFADVFFERRGPLSLRASSRGGGFRHTRIVFPVPNSRAYPASRNPFIRFQDSFERGFERLRHSYQRLLTTLIHRRFSFVPVFLLLCLSAWALVPWLGENFFPDTDSGQLLLHLRAKTGTRIEETARLADLVENSIRQVIPAQEVESILDNIGLPYSTINYMHSTSGLIGAADADILVSLKENHGPTAQYVRELRKKLPADFPGNTFYFLPADMVTQILNFGLPAPIDIQIEGADIQGNRQVADKILSEIGNVPGIADARIQQNFDYPKFHIDVDRTKAAGGGFTQRDVATSLLVSLSGSFQTTPTFFLNWQNGVNYNLATQTPQYRIQSLQDLRNMPITSATMRSPEILADVASITRSNEIAVLNHYNIRRVVDAYASVQDRDLAPPAVKSRGSSTQTASCCRGAASSRFADS